MLRCRSAACAATLAALALPTDALAKPAEGIYKGSLYRWTATQDGEKMTNAPATVKLKGRTVTVSAPKFPTYCAFSESIQVFSAQYRGTLKGSKVKGTFTYKEEFEVKMDGRFSGRKFVGDLTVQGSGATGGCSGTYTVRAAR